MICYFTSRTTRFKNNSTVVRYKDNQEIVASIPIKFQDFNERFQNTLLEIREIAVEKYC